MRKLAAILLIAACGNTPIQAASTLPFMQPILYRNASFGSVYVPNRSASFREGFPLPDNTPANPPDKQSGVSFAPGSTQTEKMTRSTREIVAIIHEVFDPVGVGDQAVRIATCESSLNPRASVIDFDGGLAVGLFQLHPHFWSAYFQGGDPYDPYVNARAALGVWRHNGNSFAGLWACRG